MLARLALTDDEIEHFTAQLEVILEHAAQIAALDTRDVPPTAHPLPSSTCCAPTRCVRACRATRCWPWRRRRKTAGSGFRASSTHRERRCPRSSSRPRCAAVPAPRARGRRRAPRRHRRADGELNACNLVMDDAARAAADAVDAAVGAGRRSRSARRRADRAQGQPLHPRRSHHVLVEDPRGVAAAVHGHGGRARAGRRRGRRWRRPTSTSSPWARRPRTRRSAFLYMPLASRMFRATSVKALMSCIGKSAIWIAIYFFP